MKRDLAFRGTQGSGRLSLVRHRKQTKRRPQRPDNTLMRHFVQVAYTVWSDERRQGNRDHPFLWELLAPRISKRAEGYAVRWSRFRLGKHEFEEALWEATWEVVQSFDPSRSTWMWHMLQVA